MKYTVTDRGIVFDIGQDYMIEEQQTDRISDEQEQQPIPLDEAVETMREISAWIEAMG